MDALSERNNVKEVRKILKELPSELDDIYDNAIKRINLQRKDDRVLGISVLMWVTTAYRKLTFLELQQALAVDPEDAELDIDGYTEGERLLSLCAGLIVIEEISGTVSLTRECRLSV